jgi:hypothetical protein
MQTPLFIKKIKRLIGCINSSRAKTIRKIPGSSSEISLMSEITESDGATGRLCVATQPVAFHRRVARAGSAITK